MKINLAILAPLLVVSSSAAFASGEIQVLPDQTKIDVASINQAVSKKDITVVETKCAEGPSSCLYLIIPSGEDWKNAFSIKKAGASSEECTNDLQLAVTASKKIQVSYKNCVGKLRVQRFQYSTVPARLFKL